MTKRDRDPPPDVAPRSSPPRHPVLTPRCLADLRHWIESQPRIALRLLDLMEACLRDPFGGTGKPERLKGDLAGLMSRRLTEADRLVYRVEGDRVVFLQARYHYD